MTCIYPHTTVRVRVTAFRVTWLALARAGQCDDIDGAEYSRVYGAWSDAGMPYDALAYIRQQCAMRADGSVPDLVPTIPPLES